MTKRAEKIKIELSNLSLKDRAELAYYLLHTLDSAEEEEEVASAWSKELERRWSEIQSGQAQGISADQAIAEILEKYS